jgi:hypothetical protein
MTSPTCDAFNLDVLEPDANLGYLPQIIPTTRDGEIEKLLSRVIDEKCVARFARLLQDGHAVVLQVFAERMASVAVRSHDVAALQLGLIALLLSWRGPDSRDALTVFPLFYDAITRLGIELPSLVASIRQTIGDQMADPLVEFLKRSESDKSLQAMGYAEGADRDGFRYIRSW